jgi:hypothetical protein
MLGDHAGAALAFARMRDAIELSQAPPSDWTQWLLEAAEWSRQTGDLQGAERYLTSAERVRPNLREVRQAQQLLAKEITSNNRQRKLAVELGSPAANSSEALPTSDQTVPIALDVLPVRALVNISETPAPPFAADETADDRELRADRLSQTLLATGRLADADFELLVTDLLALGRGPQLLALLMGRYEDASADEREPLRQMLIGALNQLVAFSSEQGLEDEALLYADQLVLIQTP